MMFFVLILIMHLTSPVSVWPVRMTGLGFLFAVKCGIKLSQIRYAGQQSHGWQEVAEAHETLFVVLWLIILYNWWIIVGRSIVLIDWVNLDKLQPVLATIIWFLGDGVDLGHDTLERQECEEQSD